MNIYAEDPTPWLAAHGLWVGKRTYDDATKASGRPYAFANVDVKASTPRLEQYPGGAGALIAAEVVDSCARHVRRTYGRALGKLGQGPWPLGGWSWEFPRRG